MKTINKVILIVIYLFSFSNLMTGNVLSESSVSFISNGLTSSNISVYLHTDRSYYIPGETIQFKAYFYDVSDNKANPINGTLNVALLDQEGLEVATGMFPVDNSQITGKIELPDILTEGNYILIAFTDTSNNIPPEKIYSSIIEIRESTDPELITNLSLSDTLYEPGSLLTARVMFSGKGDKPVPASFSYQLVGTSGEILNGKDKANSEGIATLKLQLPKFDSKESMKLLVVPSYKNTKSITGIIIPTSLNYSHDKKQNVRNIPANKSSHINIQLNTIKLQNGQDENVQLNINVTDDNGMPIKANLSVSASNIISHQPQFENGNIVSYTNRKANLSEASPNIDIRKYFTQHLIQITQSPGNQFIVQEKNNAKKLHKKAESANQKKQEGYSSDRSIFEILMEIKPYRLENGRITFGIGTMNSINNQDGALIVVDGIKMGTDASVLSTIPVSDIAHINASTNTMDIQKYSGMNNVGVIEIYTKKNSSVLKKEANVAKAKSNLLFWGPDIITDNSGKASINFINNNLSPEILISVDGIAANGLSGSSAIHYAGK
jgi:hypothetical protein